MAAPLLLLLLRVAFGTLRPRDGRPTIAELWARCGFRRAVVVAQIRRDFSLFVPLVDRGVDEAELDALMGKFFLLVAMLPTTNILFVAAQGPLYLSATASFVPAVGPSSGSLAPAVSAVLAAPSAGPPARHLVRSSVGSPSPMPIRSLSPSARFSVRGGPPLTEAARSSAALPRILAAADERELEHASRLASVLLESSPSSGRSATRGCLPVHGSANSHSWSSSLEMLSSAPARWPISDPPPELFVVPKDDEEDDVALRQRTLQHRPCPAAAGSAADALSGAGSGFPPRPRVEDDDDLPLRLPGRRRVSVLSLPFRAGVVTAMTMTRCM